MVSVSSLYTFGCDLSIFDECAQASKLESKGLSVHFLGYFQDHFDKIHALDTHNNCILTAGYGDIVFNETNVEALIPDLDVNDEIASLGLIHSAVELASTGKVKSSAAGESAGDTPSQPLSPVVAATLPSLKVPQPDLTSPPMVGFISSLTFTSLQ